MSHVAHPSSVLRARTRRASTPARERAQPAPRVDSNAAPLTLAVVVVAALLLAVAAALVSALGG